jgi:hypothetical protein
MTRRKGQQIMKLKIGLFGAAINIVVIIGMLLFSAISRGGAGFNAYLSALPLLAASAFVVYYFIVSSYVAKRAGIQNPFFFDSLVGMLAELIIVTGGTVCYSVWMTLANMQNRDPAVLASDLMTGILVNLLWIFAMFTVHILIAGNLAGIAGWYLLKKIRVKNLS